MNNIVSLPSPDPSIDVSVIIVTHNSADVLPNCLQSVYDAKCGLGIEVFVVDNASSDDSISLVKERFAEVQLIQNAKNHWFSQANNQAILRSRGRYILCLNPDTIVEPNAIKQMVQFLDANPKAGAVGARLLNQDGSLQSSCRNFLTNRNLVLQHILPWRLISKRLAGRLVLEYWDHNQPRIVDWLLGACLMVRRETIEQVGLKDESFPMFHEETDWCYRMHQAGWPVWFIPTAQVVHIGGTATMQLWGDRVILEYYRAKQRFVLKHYGRSALLAHRFLISTLLLARLARSYIAWLLKALTANQFAKDQQRAAIRFYLDALALELSDRTLRENG